MELRIEVSHFARNLRPVQGVDENVFRINSWHTIASRDECSRADCLNPNRIVSPLAGYRAAFQYFISAAKQMACSCFAGHFLAVHPFATLL
jgi:hypothetical protein